MPSSRVDLELFVQIDPEKYQSRTSLPEVVTGAQSDSSVNLSTLPFLCPLIQLLRLNLINVLLMYKEVLQVVAAMIIEVGPYPPSMKGQITSPQSSRQRRGSGKHRRLVAMEMTSKYIFRL